MGRECPVTEDIQNLQSQGQVKVNGMVWSARSTDGQHIPKGTVVRIDRIEGVKLLVSPVPVPEKL